MTVLDIKDRSRKVFLVFLSLCCPHQICCRLHCALLSRTWKDMLRYMLKPTNSHWKEWETIFLSSSVYTYSIWCKKAFLLLISSNPCRVPVLSHSGLALASLGQCAGRAGSLICWASQPAVMELCCQIALCEVSSKKAQEVFLHSCCADQGGGKGALNKLYFLRIIISKKYIWGVHRVFRSHPSVPDYLLVEISV